MMAAATVPDAAQAYALGRDNAESDRLRRQSDELRPEAVVLLDRVGLAPGQAAIDLGCGPSGILDLLSAAVSPGGRVVGLDADPRHIAMAARHVRQLGLANVELMWSDAGNTGLPRASFDFVHARTLLVTIPEPGQVVAEMIRLARPGGWIASQEPDCEYSLCYPPILAWDRLHELFLAGFGRSGANPRIGRRLTELFRDAGLTEIGMASFAPAYPVGHSRRTLLPDLVHSLRPMILELGLSDDQELDEVDQTVRRHLADPRTVVIPHLLMVTCARNGGRPGKPLFGAMDLVLRAAVAREGGRARNNAPPGHRPDCGWRSAQARGLTPSAPRPADRLEHGMSDLRPTVELSGV
jgi:ubiquinone/menaquinone biosynthesis C-methylase UbiE